MLVSLPAVDLLLRYTPFGEFYATGRMRRMHPHYQKLDMTFSGRCGSDSGRTGLDSLDRFGDAKEIGPFYCVANKGLDP